MASWVPRSDNWLDVENGGTIRARHIEVGVGARIDVGVEIDADTVSIGPFVHITPSVRINVPHFAVGDYTKIHRGCFLHGYKPLTIGRNCWIGEHTVLDSIGGLEIEDNVGIGAHSQVWTHVQHGDIVEGCRFHSSHPVRIGRDAWLVGHCIANMEHMAERSMALAGSVVTHNTEPNHVYAGVPARDVTDKLGPQFEERTTAQKLAALFALVVAFEARHPEHRLAIQVSCDGASMDVVGRTYINVDRRTYTQTLTLAEVTFLKETPLLRVVPA